MKTETNLHSLKREKNAFPNERIPIGYHFDEKMPLGVVSTNAPLEGAHSERCSWRSGAKDENVE